MSRYRLSDLAKADIATVLRHQRNNTRRRRPCPLPRLADGGDAADRGRAARTIYRGPQRARRRRASFHIRHSRNESHEAAVGDPVHVIFYRALSPDLVEIVRVLHERMEPGRHMGSSG